MTNGAKQGRANQMTGREGEKQFSLRCTQADVTCNQSIEDDFGWDMVIEFPPKPQVHKPIDQRDGPVTASVQVKSSKGTKHSVTISLDNAIRYAKSALPTFIVLVVLREGKEPRFFVKHVWSELIGEWLRIGREADAAGVVVTHKERVTVRFDPADEHTADLLSWIEDEASPASGDYATRKLDIARTIGFEDGYGTAQVTVQLDQPHDFLDLQLGIKSSLKAPKFVFTSERFGIAAGKPDLDLDDVELSLTPNGRPATLRLSFQNGRVMAAPATFYSASAGHSWATRVSTQVLDLRFGSDKRVTAERVATEATILPVSLIGIFAQLQASNAIPVGLEVELDDMTIGLGTMTLTHDAPAQPWADLALAADVLEDIVSKAAKPLPPMSIAMLDHARIELQLLAALGSERALRLNAVTEPDVPEAFHTMLAHCIVTVGDLAFGALARRPIVIDKTEDGRRDITFGGGTFLSARWSTSASFDANWLRDEYWKHLNRLSATGEVLALGDLRKFTERPAGDQPIMIDRPDQPPP